MTYVPIKQRPGYKECADKILAAWVDGKAKGAEGRRLVAIVDQTCPRKSDSSRPLWMSARREFLSKHGFPSYKRVKRDPNQIDLIEEAERNESAKSDEPKSTIYDE